MEKETPSNELGSWLLMFTQTEVVAIAANKKQEDSEVWLSES